MSCCIWATTAPQAAIEDAGKQASTAQLMFDTTIHNFHAILCYTAASQSLRSYSHGESPSNSPYLVLLVNVSLVTFQVLKSGGLHGGSESHFSGPKRRE
ncbi:hypothetical protein CIPAW_10G049200 [Carya illinoinensis]|nr:hypothetical protein CIPAW_10G049200 [Carya illinoinensis]